MKEIAILLTCFNRREKTLSCLNSLFSAKKPDNVKLNIFIVDDASSDGTYESISLNYPFIHLLKGNGNLYWAGGMRMAWDFASRNGIFDYVLLLNDDVILKKDFLLDLFVAEEFLTNFNNTKGIYISSTESYDNKVSYGGNRLTRNRFGFSIKKITPIDKPQFCDIANANIMLIHKSVIDKIGFFDNNFIHGIADYDYSLSAIKNNISIVMSSNFGGYCDDDHYKDIPTNKTKLSDRITYLKSPTGLAYDNYIYFIRKHFPSLLIPVFFNLWFRTIFPKIWSYIKNVK